MTPVTPGRSMRLLSPGRLMIQGAIVVFTAVSLGGCPPPVPATPNPNLVCFPGISGVPGFGGAPTIDGHLSGTPQVSPPAEFGWTGSTRYTFGNGTQTPDAAVQGIRDGSNLYLSFEVNFASSPDIKDGILIVFRPTANTPANDRRIFVAPFQNNVPPPANTPVSPQSVQYWVDSTNDAWNDPNQAAGQAAVNPAFLFNNIKIQRDASNTWYLEMKIPTGGGATNGIANKGNDTTINLPASGDFGFYFDILDHPQGGYIEHTFPENTGLTPSQGIAAPGTNTPAAAAWGRGSLGGIQCNGVSFDGYRDIKIKHANVAEPTKDGIISTNQSNQFTVTVWNDSVDANGNRIQALDVDARFRIANFGINPASDYADIPNGTHNCPPNAAEPSAHTCVNATVPVPPNNTIQGSTIIQAPDWTLTNAQKTIYGAPNDHQCILVELDSNATNPFTILRNKSSVRNMDFATTASPYRETVSVSAGRERREDSDMILVTRASNTPPDAKWSVTLQGAQPIPGATNAFTLRVPAGKASPIGAIAEPPPIAIPSQDIRIPANAGADGRGVSIPVKPGNLITLIASGSIQVRRDQSLRAGPEGAVLEARSDSQQYGSALLPPGLSPSTRIGALVGAWNGNFKENPVIVGTAATLKAPQNAQTLVLALNDTQAGYAEHTGEGFQVQVIQTPLEPYFAITDTTVLREPSAERLRVPLGANLPTVVTCGYRKTSRQISVNGFTDYLLEKVGCFGYQFNKIGIATTPR